MDIPAPLKFGMGASARRKEDKAFITGAGRYVDDFSPEGVLRAHVLRSSMAHARIGLGNLEAARAMPGVRLILTGADMAGLGSIPCKIPTKFHDGRDAPAPRRAPLAERTARHP